MNLRERERESIRAFLRIHAFAFHGKRVLDYGAGRQPYRDLVEESGGEYVPFDSPAFPASVAERDTTELERGPWDVILCTQVVQYVPAPLALLEMFHAELEITGGKLLMTGPTNWPIVEREDRWRITLTGIEALAREAGFSYAEGGYRHAGRIEGEEYPYGWAMIATV